MPPEVRLLSLECDLPGEPVSNETIGSLVGASSEDVLASTGIRQRHHAADGQGPSDLAREASERALGAAAVGPADLSMIVFATATPDVAFPGSACFLQEKIGAGTVGAVDIRAQSAGFIAGLDLAAALCSVPGPAAEGPDGPSRILLAAGEVFSSGLDMSPGGRSITPRLADGAAAAVVGQGDTGIGIASLAWYTDGALADRFWCEFPASRRYPLRLLPEDIEQGRHYPSADLPALGPVVRQRLVEVGREVLGAAGWAPEDLALAIVDYVEPGVAHAAADDLGIGPVALEVPTESFGHVMAAGLPLQLALCRDRLESGAKVLLAAAGPGLAWGAVALEWG